MENNYQTGWIIYKERWFVLFVAIFANFSAGSLWMSYSTLILPAIKYFETTVENLNLLPLSVLICSILTSLLAMYILDKKNLKTGLRIGVFFTFIGYILRISPIFISLSYKTKFLLSLLGHCFIGFAFPFLIFTPSKVAEHWFSDEEQVFATTVISLGYLIGLLFSDLISRPLYNLNFEIPSVTFFLGIPSLISIILVFFLKRSKPKTPPNGSAAIFCYRPFFPSVYQLFNQKAFCILMFYIGITLGSFISTILVVQQFITIDLKKMNYSGIFASAFISGGILGSFISCLFIKKMNNILLVMKIFALGHCISYCLLYLTLRYPFIDIKDFWNILILFLSGLTGFFSFTIIPLGLTLGSHCSFPNCSEAVANGLLLVSGQFFGLILTIIMRLLSYKVRICKLSSNFEINSSFLFNSNKNKCIEEDYDVSMLVQCIIIVISGLIFVFLFDIHYRIMNNTRRFNVNRILQINEREDTNLIYS